MIILGIDPGLATVGYSIIRYNNNKHKLINYGIITTTANTPFEKRLLTINQDLNSLIKKHTIDQVAIEKIFFQTNAKTAINVAQARGAIILTCAKKNLPIFNYTPLQIKLSICGYGKADKKQIQFMTANILKLKTYPKSDDAADAIAVAICHANSTSYQKIKQF